MMTDPIADMLTRIRNANSIERPFVSMPATKLKANVAQVLKDEGFITDYTVGMDVADEEGNVSFKTVSDYSIPKLVLKIAMKYGQEGERVIRHIARKSKPGCRRYVRADQIRPVLNGLGISILSTSKGVMSSPKAKAQRLGGELLCEVW